MAKDLGQELENLEEGIEDLKNKEFRILSRIADGNPANEGPFRTIGQFGQMNGPTEFTYSCPIRLASNTDIEVRAIGTASAPACGATFDLILIDGQDTVVPGTGVD